MTENTPLQDKDRDHRHVGESISTTALHRAKGQWPQCNQHALTAQTGGFGGRRH